MRIPKSATFASAFENGGSDSLTFWQKRSRNPFLFSCYLVLFVSWIPPLKRKMKKNFRFIWSIWNKVLTFAPAFKMRAALFDNLFETRAVTTVLFLCSSFRKRDDLKKEKNKKKLPKIFGRYEIKSLPLHPLLKRKAIVKQAIFEQIYINNTSSTRAGTFLIFKICIWVKKRTVNTYNI